MNQLQAKELLHLELFTGEDILQGTVSCPSSLRLFDVLNQAKEFCVFHDFCQSDSEINGDKNDCLYVRTGAISFAAVEDFDTGRGVKAKGKSWVGFPVIAKAQRQVTVRLQNAVINGDVHFGRGQSLADLMNDERSFLPLTNASIAFRSNQPLNRPFVAINKRQIILIKNREKS